MDERTKYYYYRDDKNRPVVTVCLLQANGDIARGWTVCSVLDNPCKKTGRKISKDRAVYAIKTKGNSCQVKTTTAILTMMGINRFGLDLLSDFKSTFNPALTQLENKLIYGEGI